MLGSTWRNSTLAIGAALLTAGLATADGDTIRLGGRSGVDDTPVQRLDMRGGDDAEVTPAWYRHRGYGGYRGGFYGGYGYRGYYGGYGGYGYRTNYGYGYGYRPYYGYGYGYRPYYSSYYYRPSYYYGSYYGGYYGGYCGISETYVAPAAVVTLNIRPNPVIPRIQDDNVVPNPAPKDGFRYDGGPDKPVPMPPKDEATPKAPVERLVSIPAPKKYQYAAYGEQPGPVTQPRDDAKTIIVRGVSR